MNGMKTPSIDVQQAPRPCCPLPPERPMPMPHQHLAISPVVSGAVRRLAFFGQLAQRISKQALRRRAQEMA